MPTTSIPRSKHTDFPAIEMADRLAIRELVDAYANCADSRDTEGQMALFAEDCEFIIFMDSRSKVPSQEIRGREKLRPVFENLKTYAATTHFNGQSTITINGSWSNGL